MSEEKKEEKTTGSAPVGYMAEKRASCKQISMAILANSCAGSPGREMTTAAKTACHGAEALWDIWVKLGWSKG